LAQIGEQRQLLIHVPSPLRGKSRQRRSAPVLAVVTTKIRAGHPPERGPSRVGGDIEPSETISLRNARVHTALPASDLERAKQYFREKLGLTPASETESIVFYQVREAQVVLFLSNGRPSGEHTQVGWTVGDIEEAVAALRNRGVVFEDYEDPDFATADGIATFGPNRFAWFRDSEGNMHNLAQFG
jgi:catechol 2,3-dioxygenase-like lactoylglutathione lyase family enzyme